MNFQKTLKEVENFGILPLKELYSSAKKANITDISDLTLVKKDFENNLTAYISYDTEFFINKKRKLNFYDLENIDNIIQSTIRNYKKHYL